MEKQTHGSSYAVKTRVDVTRDFFPADSLKTKGKIQGG